MELKDAERESAVEPDWVARQQPAYAAWLSGGSRLGLAILIVTFLAYVLDIHEPHVPIEHLPRLWSLPAAEFRLATDGPLGWQWLALMGRGDFLTYAGVAILSLTTIACYLRVVPLLFVRGERLFGILGAVQIAVLLLAASGLLAGGH